MRLSPSGSIDGSSWRWAQSFRAFLALLKAGRVVDIRSFAQRCPPSTFGPKLWGVLMQPPPSILNAAKAIVHTASITISFGNNIDTHLGIRQDAAGMPDPLDLEIIFPAVLPI